MQAFQGDALSIFERVKIITNNFKEDKNKDQFMWALCTVYLEPFLNQNNNLKNHFEDLRTQPQTMYEALCKFFEQQDDLKAERGALHHDYYRTNKGQTVVIDNFFRGLELIIAECELLENPPSSSPDKPSSSPLPVNTTGLKGHAWQPPSKPSFSLTDTNIFFDPYPYSFISDGLVSDGNSKFDLPRDRDSSSLVSAPKSPKKIMKKEARVQLHPDGAMVINLDLDQTLVRNVQQYKIFHVILAEIIRQFTFALSYELSFLPKETLKSATELQIMDQISSVNKGCSERIIKVEKDYLNLLGTLKQHLPKDFYNLRIQPIENAFESWEVSSSKPGNLTDEEEKNELNFLNLLFIDANFLTKKLALPPTPGGPVFRIEPEWNNFFSYFCSQKTPNGTPLFYIVLCSLNIYPSIILRAMREGKWGLDNEHIDYLEANKDANAVYNVDKKEGKRHHVISSTEALKRRGLKILDGVLIDDDVVNCQVQREDGKRAVLFQVPPLWSPADAVIQAWAIVKELEGDPYKPPNLGSEFDKSLKIYKLKLVSEIVLETYNPSSLLFFERAAPAVKSLKQHLQEQLATNYKQTCEVIESVIEEKVQKIINDMKEEEKVIAATKRELASAPKVFYPIDEPLTTKIMNYLKGNRKEIIQAVLEKVKEQSLALSQITPSL